METSQVTPHKGLTIFLVIMGLLFFISPMAREAGMGTSFFKGIISAVSISCIYLVSRSRLHILLACLLAIPGIGMTLSTNSFDYSILEVVGLTTNIVLYFFVIYIIAIPVVTQKIVNQHVIAGAVSIYLLLGLVWSFIYMLIELITPNSFYGLYTENYVGSHSLTQVFNHLFYYSYVTLTTLGYGNISPRSIEASAFASAEAIVGQLYIALVIARLVGLYTAQELRRNEPNSN